MWRAEGVRGSGAGRLGTPGCLRGDEVGPCWGRLGEMGEGGL